MKAHLARTVTLTACLTAVQIAHALTPACNTTSDTTFLYVANTGEKGTPDGTMAHPYTSLTAARDAIRQIRKRPGSPLAAKPITVRLRKGIYELTAGFTLTAEDGGTEDAPITYTAFPGEEVTLCGGKRLPAAAAAPVSGEAAQRIHDGQALSHIREIDLGRLGLSDYGVNHITGFRRPYVNAAMELFINGQPYQLARYPNNDKIRFDTSDVVDNGISNTSASASKTTHTDIRTTLTGTSTTHRGTRTTPTDSNTTHTASNTPHPKTNPTHPGSIRLDKNKLAQWTHAHDMMAAGNFSYAWATDQTRIAAADPATGILTFADAHPFAITGGKEWSQYYIFNLLEELDQPGEYYIDHQKGKLYFYPLQPLNSSDTLEVSVLEDALVSLKKASYVQFSNLTLEAGRGMGIYMENTVSDRIINCTIRNMGVVGVCIGKGSAPEKVHRLPDPFDPNCPDEKLSGRLGSLHELLYENTVFFREGGQHNGIVGCRIVNTGCGGISLGGGDRSTLTPGGNYIDSCTFTNCGRIDYSYKSPVNIDGIGNKVQHCLFNACPATAIYLHGNNHLIEHNIIREACSFVDDQGAIYMGRDPSEAGNIIRRNFFSNIGHLGMTMAVYFDDGACGSEVCENVFYKAGTRTIMVGGGSYNHIHNNIFIDSKMAFHLDDRLSNWSKPMLDTGGLFAFRLRQVGYDRPPYAAAYPWLKEYFIHHPEQPRHNDIENNVLVNVEQLHNGLAEWGPIHPDNLVLTHDMDSPNTSPITSSPITPSPITSSPANPSRPPATFTPHDSSWKKLSLRQKIGQTMIMLPDRPLELQLGNGSLHTYFKKYPVSGFFMGWKLWTGIRPENKLAHIRAMTASYQQASELPLLFQEDYESGINIPGMTSFPNEMTLGAANSPDLAYAYGAAVAKESRAVGVKWVLHPVADLNINPLNPIMNVRSIGDDPDQAIQLLSRQIRGLQDNGVAATIKHFPGDGVDARDQHLLTTCNSLPFAVWRQLHGKVFQALIDSGVACIMPGHITLPSYQTEKINGFTPPATLSHELLTDLLKGEMGFKGVVVSDAMTMGGFGGYFRTRLEGEIQSFIAGVDILLWPSYEYMDTLEARITRGEIPMQRLDDAVRRVWALKERFGILDMNRQLIQPLTAADKQQAGITASAICDQAVTLVRDRTQSLPLRPSRDKKILVVGVAPVARKGGSDQLDGIRQFAASLRQRGFQVDFRHDILYETQGWMEEAPDKYDRIIFVVARAPHTPFGPLQLWDDEAQSVWAANALPKEKTIVISLGSPYIIDEYFERINTCINAYSNTPVMHAAVIRALLGEKEMKGISPVDLHPAPSTDTLAHVRECRPRNGLPNLFKKLQGGQPVTIAYLGGSITQAAKGYREQTTAWLQQQYPEATITAINAGVGGTRSDLGCFRLQQQVLAHNPDLVFVEFAVNDKDSDPATIHETMEGIVRQIWRDHPLTDICFVYTMTAEMQSILSKGRLPAAARAMEDVAEYYHIPSVDLCLQIVALSSAGKLIYQGKPEDHPDKMVFSADNVHPYPQTGHRLYTEALTRSLVQMASQPLTAAGPHYPPAPFTPDRLEEVQMIPADHLQRTGAWATVAPAKENEGSLTPDPFPVLLKTNIPGSAITIKFKGTMVGLYDLIGPGSGSWDVSLDGRPYQHVTRFDAFATWWRPHYVLLTGIPAGIHTVEFRCSAQTPDKKSLLGDNLQDFTAHPEKYTENAGYAGYLLLAGQLIDSK
jgi:beta-N-acetylhexosaminidase